jgi:ADP-dependent NAD(P)H-hydrate dehydratase / NAD(P)H-hydrate epimerase
MKIVTASEMSSIDAKTIKEYRIPSSVLMERAGLSVANKIIELFDRKKVIVLSGGGNNGGDGIVAARELYNRGWNVKVFLLLKEDKLSPDCLAQYRIAKQIGVPLEFRTSLNEKDIHSAIIVDAIFGTGINKPMTSPMSEIINFLNKSDINVVSVDIPSGISSDNARIMGEAVRADYTVTFGLPKIGHILHPGAEYTGRLFIEDIGFPEELLKSDNLRTQTIEKQDAALLLPERSRNSYKSDYGHVLIVAGSRGKTGAALMAAKSCLRAGAGMVTIGVPDTLVDIFQQRVTEEMVLPLNDTGRGTLSVEASATILDFINEKADVLAIGPGITCDADIAELMRRILETATVPMVLDADAVNSLSGRTEMLKAVKAPVILTPHAGEMARLLSKNLELRTKNSKFNSWKAEEELLRSQIEKDKIKTAVSFSNETGTYLVLKGAPTVISEPEGRVFINTTGNPGMSTAGSGDVLTGIIAAFLGQGLNPMDASVLGTYIHGLAGDIAASEKGMYSLIASDITDKLPGAFSSLKND